MHLRLVRDTAVSPGSQPNLHDLQPHGSSSTLQASLLWLCAAETMEIGCSGQKTIARGSKRTWQWMIALGTVRTMVLQTVRT